MPRFMDVHDGFSNVSQEQLEAAHRADLEVQDREGVKFTHWWGDPATGKVFCLAEGPSREAVARVHTMAGHPTDQIYQLSLEGE